MAHPPAGDGAPRILHLDDVERIAVAGVEFRPVRRSLGVTAFGINAFTGDAGEPVIEEHDETGAGAGGHEELYLVVAGAATFELDGETVEVPVGGMVFLPDVATRRGAIARRRPVASPCSPPPAVPVPGSAVDRLRRWACRGSQGRPARLPSVPGRGRRWRTAAGRSRPRCRPAPSPPDDPFRAADAPASSRRPADRTGRTRYASWRDAGR